MGYQYYLDKLKEIEIERNRIAKETLLSIIQQRKLEEIEIEKEIAKEIALESQ